MNPTSLITNALLLLTLLLIQSSLIRTASTTSIGAQNWDSNNSAESSRKSSLSNSVIANENLEQIYQYLLKRLNDGPFKDQLFDSEPDKSDDSRFNRQERHLRFGKRFTPRAKYSDLDYGHMRFGRK